MDLMLGALLTRILIDVSLAFLAFFVGFFTAYLYSRHVSAKRRRVVAPAGSPVAAPAAKPAAPDAAANEIARANMAAQQLRDLAQNVASDVGAHNTLVEGIADQLGALTQGENGNSAVVMQAVAKIVEANKKLAARLEDAEQKIQSQAEEIRTQQSEARTDALTKLANRRAFDGFLVECVDKYNKSNKPFSLVLFDVDHFKKFNDAHGHQAGDEVLRTVGRTLSKTVTANDLACRYGGEEFAVVLANTSASDAQVAAERIRKAIEAMAVNFQGDTLRVTASIGMAAYIDAEGAAQLVRRADEGVYASKKDGRNCSHWHDGEKCVRITQKAQAEPPPHDALLENPEFILPPASPEAMTIPNRAAFGEELGRRIAESHRFGFPLTLIYFRVKDFGRLQLLYGNAIGAMLIDSLAAFIQSNLREMDLLGRFDDGEIIVMLPGSTDSASKIVGQRVKTSISLCPIPLGSQQIRLDLDMGVATVQPHENASAAIASAKADMEAAANAEARGEQPVLAAEAAGI